MNSYWLSENLWVLRLEASEETTNTLLSLEAILLEQFRDEVIETVCTACTLGIYISSHISSDQAEFLTKEWEQLALQTNALPSYSPKTIEIPVVYGGQEGPDLEFVATYNGLTVQEVIEIHTAATYPVTMIGFAPGFPYLEGLSERIHAPRKSTPRMQIPAGSVGIAGEQTGIYSLSTPGGWQIIGRTQVPLFLPFQMPPSLLQAGDLVKFVAVERGDSHD